MDIISKSQENSLTLITANLGKLKEFESLLPKEFNIQIYKLDLPELQGKNSIEIAKQKTLFAFEKLKKPVIIEDTSLCFDGLNGLPGPYIKWFYEELKNEGLVKMISGFNNNKAKALGIIGYMDEYQKEPLIFVGSVEGQIVNPIGDQGFGWDPIFKPDEQELTYAQMDLQMKNQFSFRKQAIQSFISFLSSYQIHQDSLQKKHKQA